MVKRNKKRKVNNSSFFSGDLKGSAPYPGDEHPGKLHPGLSKFNVFLT